MLARNDLRPIAPFVFEQEREQVAADFEWWHALLVEPNREERAAKWFETVHVIVYWPAFLKKSQCRGKSHRHRLHAVMPGLLFIPEQMMKIDRRDEILEYAHSRGFIRTSSGLPARLKKIEIEIIRQIEAKLNLPPERKNVLFEVGQEIRFTNELYAAFWGTGVIFEIASEARIGLEVEKVIGGPTKVYVPASEIEAM